MLRDSCDPLVKNTQPSVITDRKWKAKIPVENAESALRMKEIIGTEANGKAGLGLHPLSQWAKESMLNRRKMVSEELHHLEEVRHFVVGQTGCMDQVGECKRQSCHMEQPQAHGTKKIKFPHKSNLWHLNNTSQPSYLGLTTSDRCRACGKTAILKHILTGCEYALRSYTWRQNKVQEIFAEAANKALNIINNRAIQFV